ncbi:hypothetical protein [Natrinema sp. 1APR25-10V2]|uniref:hypothetical protein n=1 Tax=Natrinema sp. 1APR25-10V2 TaxID=2951081 RepID=UPI0028772127|nr:hypothetical protein [Natrinema sp. 1APR25-10V2]MDS0475760.1 hypothetical protein [Natrinema sp. 1APR25-10V2]
MSDTETSTEIVDEPVGSASGGDASIGREYVSRAIRGVREGSGLEIAAGIGGGASILGGVRALQRGDRERAFGRFALGGVLVAIALELRRPTDEHTGAEGAVDQTDVVSTAPDIGGLEGGAADEDRHAGGADAQRVVDSSVDLEDVTAGTEPDDEAGADVESGTGPAVPEPEAYERLGAAAFDEHSSEIPVPQEAFNRNVLSLSAEAFWGIRDEDDAVVVSERFDPIQDGEGIRYVASSEIDGDRMLSVPDTVLNHWDTVAGGGLAVASGTDIAFVTADSLQAEGQIRLVPEQWLDDVLEDSQ